MRRWLVLAAVGIVGAVLPAGAPPAAAQSYQRISGSGSTWSATAIEDMRNNVAQFGMTVDYSATGSSQGRKDYLNGTVDFAASDIPFQFEPEDGSPAENPERDSYAYIPVTAGGTAFMYHLKINGRRVTNLRLSGENIAKIFTGAITQWNDPALVADNPGLTLPGRPIVPVVRSDGSGSTHQFTRWLIAEHGGIWDDYCERSDRAPTCGATSFYPTIPGVMIGQQGDQGVAGYVAQNYGEGAIGYVNYSYALNAGFPVAKVLNAAGYYTEPTPANVAVSLLQARINQNRDDPTVYLTQELDGVYNDSDARNYPLSSYSYFILRTKTTRNFDEDKGRTVAEFARYAMCQAQHSSESLGYSPIPINLVEASFDQIRLIPGAEIGTINVQDCDNPTFSADGTNTLAAEAPMPPDCDKQGPNQCADGTGGTDGEPTPVNPGASGGQGGGGTDTGGGTGNTTGGTGGSGTDGSATGGTDGSGTGGTGGTGGSGTGTGTSTGNGAEVACDPDTGICGSPAGGGFDDGNGGGGDDGGGQATALPTTIPVSAGWSGSEALIILIILLTFGAIVGPALAWTRLSSPDRKPT